MKAQPIKLGLGDELPMNGKDVKRFLVGEGCFQVTIRCSILLISLLLIVAYSFKEGKWPLQNLDSIALKFFLFFIGSIILLIFMSIIYTKAEKSNIDISTSAKTSWFSKLIQQSLNLIHEYYCKNELQKAWNDLFVWLLFVSLINFGFGIVSEFLKNGENFGFELWKLSAIIMSIVLAVIYFRDMLVKYNDFIKDRRHVIDEETFGGQTKYIILMIISGLLLFLTIIFVLLHIVHVTLSILIACMIIFMIIDYNFVKCLERSKEDKGIGDTLKSFCFDTAEIKEGADLTQEELDSLHMYKLLKSDGSVKLSQKGKKCLKSVICLDEYYTLHPELTAYTTQKYNDEIKNYRNNFAYGNLPALIGFVVLLIAYFLFPEIPIDTVDDGPKAETINYARMLEVFVAGGAAMHMIFGNIIVAISLGGGTENQ